jgi:hypothetical protein
LLAGALTRWRKRIIIELSEITPYGRRYALKPRIVIMSINLSSFNIFWYRGSKSTKNPRSEADQERIARVLARLDAHGLVFQEILDCGRLESLLATIEGHDFRLRQKPGGEWLTSGNPQSKASMKTVCAFDANIIDLIAAAPLRNPEIDPDYECRRDPYAMHLRVRETGAEFTLVGVHLKSGFPNAGPDDESAQIRHLETAFLASWLAGTAGLEPGSFQRPPTEDVIVMGDCNATEDNFSLTPLHEGWHWPLFRVAASLDPLNPLLLDDPDERWTTFLDRMVIDHALVSPTVLPKIGSALIYAFDLDPGQNEDPADGNHWLRRTTDYQVEPYEKAGVQLVANLYRISDHRPVRITMDPV